MLVDFYERLGKIETKVDKIKDNVTAQQAKETSYREGLSAMSKMLMKKPDEALKMIKEHDSK